MGIGNGVLMQYFQWYLPADASLWRQLASNAPVLAAKGITAVWIPPCYKGSGGIYDTGYGCYDLFDLGEFDQKNSVPTKYGTKNELLEAIRSLQASNIDCYADVVFNHKDGGDAVEIFQAQEVRWDDRNQTIGGWQDIKAYTKFTFDKRNGMYSSMVWDHECFDALTFNVWTGNNDHLYRIKDKTFSTEVSHEHFNDDYLIANDLDTSYPAVQAELLNWGKWFLKLTGVNGFRIDACKHIRFSFFPEWLTANRVLFEKEYFSVGEYWSGDVEELHSYITETGGAMSLFDVPLHYHFQRAGNEGNGYDMRYILLDTLMQQQPMKAVTFVENHDTQPGQSLASAVQDWFKPLAYALILLRAEGYPCIFYADYFGAKYITGDKNPEPVSMVAHQWIIDRFLSARKQYGFGDQHDYFDHPNTIGWTRLGTADHPGSMAVVLTNGADGYKWMNMYRPLMGYKDFTGHFANIVNTNEDGWGCFPCPSGSVSVWLQQ